MYLTGLSQLRSLYTAFLRVALWVLLGGAAAEFVYHSAEANR